MFSIHGDLMKKINFLESSHSINDFEISMLEGIIGSALPSEMKSLYKAYNGGQPQPSFVHDDAHLYPINAFYSIEEIINSYKDQEDVAVPDGFYKHEILPFAYDPGSGTYSLSLRNRDFGYVYFYVLHETVETFGIWTSFESFIGSIVDDPKNR